MRNNYDKNIFNGDTGIISSMAADRSTLSIQFGQESIEYTKSELSELQLAYCISIHKSQGSEYPVVIIPILKQHFITPKKSVYTGITRARKKVYLVGCLDAYAMAVKNNKQQVRLTNLCHQLKNSQRIAVAESCVQAARCHAYCQVHHGLWCRDDKKALRTMEGL